MLGPRLRAFGKSVWGIVSESASLCVWGVAQCVLQGCMCVYVACVLWQEFCRACLECPSVMRDAAKEEVKLLAFATIMDEASVAKCDEQAKALEDLEAKAVSDSYSGMLKGALVATGFGIVANMVKAELEKRRNQSVVGKSLGGLLVLMDKAKRQPSEWIVDDSTLFTTTMEKCTGHLLHKDVKKTDINTYIRVVDEVVKALTALRDTVVTAASGSVDSLIEVAGMFVAGRKDHFEDPVTLTAFLSDCRLVQVFALHSSVRTYHLAALANVGFDMSSKVACLFARGGRFHQLVREKRADGVGHCQGACRWHNGHPNADQPPQQVG